MTSHTNEALLRRFYDEALSKGNVNVVDELVDRNFVDHEPNPPGFKSGIEGTKQVISAMRTGFPDLQVAVNEVIPHGDKVVARVTLSGTHKGKFMDIPPTGKRVSFEGIDIVRFSGGKAVEHWGLTDNMGLFTQLGAIPAPGESPKK
ncbi:MAG TPA: ester cyclase [Thermoplasmata archaeon]|nr:ester cyclase [Thermoplasmata archaeon]HLA47218.1 ester cyclase [Thermoplasmata archaeon]